MKDFLVLCAFIAAVSATMAGYAFGAVAGNEKAGGIIGASTGATIAYLILKEN